MTAPTPCGYNRPHEPHTFTGWNGQFSIAGMLAAGPAGVAPVLELRSCPGIPEQAPAADVWCFTHGAPLAECFTSAARFGPCQPDRSEHDPQ